MSTYSQALPLGVIMLAVKVELLLHFKLCMMQESLCTILGQAVAQRVARHPLRDMGYNVFYIPAMLATTLDYVGNKSLVSGKAKMIGSFG